MQYRQIEIDLDVNRWIESKRLSFEQTPNDILRAEAGFPAQLRRRATVVSRPEDSETVDTGAWSGKGAVFPEGTRMRMSYNGRVYTGVIESGMWFVNGERHGSPSAAASTLAGVSINGWAYWEAQLPGKAKWAPISAFRTAVAQRRTLRD
jgi:hypothetical protein